MSPGADSGLTVGLQATVTAEVGEDDTALALGSGDLPVLGTPRLLALAEAACVAAVAPQLPAGQTTVGAAVSLEHRKPSPLGTPIEVRAELVEVTGRKLFFGFIAYGPGTDDEAVIGAGTVQRVLVDAEQFLRRAGAGPAGAA
ncbi:MAG TPA: hotdog domain-containing protein [Streptosporangiaceae bacterium]|nr:hotdog domain-containing protein [Streptosporangiaceae bacterium]